MSDPALLAAPWVLAAGYVIVAAGVVVQNGLGMGFGIVVAPLLALIHPALVPAPVLVLGALGAAATAWSERRAIVWPEVGFTLAGRLTGVTLATLLLVRLADADAFATVFGVLVLAAVLMALIGRGLPFTRANLTAAGVVSGFMGTITSVGAPPLALVYQARPPARSRATLSAFFALGTCLSLAGLLIGGVAGMGDLVTAMLFLPAMLAGLLAAKRMRGRFDRRYRNLLRGLAGVAAVLLIARGLV